MVDYCSWSPDRLFGVDISDCCKLHDYHYAKKDISREQADLQLKEDIHAKFKEAHKGFYGDIVSFVYFMGVRLFGWLPW
jgi:hypothetical protein